MNVPSPKASTCKDSSSISNSRNSLPPTGSQHFQQISAKLSRGLAFLAASGLVLASAGFGCVYAWQLGSHHGLAIAGMPILGWLAVLMAGALEIVKPLAMSRTLTSGASNRFALSIVAAVACLYSLTAELSLMAMIRADQSAGRLATIEQSGDHRVLLLSARSELSSVAPSRAVAEIEPLIVAAVAKLPKGTDCASGQPTRERRLTCNSIAELRSELGRAERRAELASKVERLSQAPTESVQAVSKADPGADALAAYFAALGLAVGSEKVTLWLAIVPVLALELGSLLSGLLIRPSTSPAERSFKGATSTDTGRVQTGNIHGVQSIDVENADNAHTRGPPEGVHSVSTRPPAKILVPSDYGARLVQLLNDRGGEVFTGHRALGTLIGCSTAHVGNVLRDLTKAGVVAVYARKNGTVLKLMDAHSSV